MAASVIPISLDSSEKSVGSYVPRVILFVTIPTSILVIHVVHAEVPIAPAILLVAPEVVAVSIISPTGVLDLVDYSFSSDSDPSEDSLPLAPELPLVLPFLCSDDSKADNESKPAEQRPERHESVTPSFEFPLAPVVAPPGIRQWPAILVRPSESIPFGEPYRTNPNCPRKLLTVRKRVRPFLARRLAWRCASHRSSNRHSSPDFTLDSSSSGSSSDSSSDISSCSSLDSLSDSSSVHSLRCDASESSLDSSYERSLDSSSHSAGPSRKRCRFPTTLVPSSTPVLRSIALTLADLLPPRKRFRDSCSSEDSEEEHMEIGTADAEAIADLGISDGVGAHTEDGIVDLLVTRGNSDPSGGDALDLERQLEASGERAGLVDKVRSLGRENLRVRALLCIERDRVDSLRRHMALSQEEFRQIRRDRDDTRRRLRRLESLVERRLGFCFEMEPATRTIASTSNNEDEGINERQRNQNQNQFTRMTKVDFPKSRDDLKGWIFKCEQFFSIDEILENHKVNLWVESLLLLGPLLCHTCDDMTDASGVGIRAVLQQNGYPIAYMSKTLSFKHQSLSTYEKEFLAVLLALEKWRGYLMDKHFIIKTDHFSLKYLLDQRIITPTQMKWLPKLIGFYYEVVYKKGSENGPVDALSRVQTSELFSVITTLIEDKVFLSNFWSELFKLLQVLLLKSTSYHPQTDGQTEVVNKCLEGYLRGVSKVEAVDKTLKEREEFIQTLKVHLLRAQNRMKQQADRGRSKRNLEARDWVLLKLQPHSLSARTQLKGYKGEVPSGQLIDIPLCDQNGMLAAKPLRSLDRKMVKKRNAIAVYGLAQ
uniref:Gypsy/Ty3 retroelement polyprotein n=1 Tax=Tanacetum cinerariifolium TaxID=118510 RepID=A0A6L2NHE1_TANCI|nr:gypsy/Ty3 retroelement polyprotein [Tanacetum cinerariifolium]